MADEKSEAKEVSVVGPAGDVDAAPEKTLVGAKEWADKHYAIPVAANVDGEWRVLTLTKKQIKFFDIWLRTGNLEEAAEKCGIGIKRATSWVKKKAYESYLAERRTQVAISQTVSPDAVKSFWVEVMRGTKEANKNQMRASELLAKNMNLLNEGGMGDSEVDLAIFLKRRPAKTQP